MADYSKQDIFDIITEYLEQYGSALGTGAVHELTPAELTDEALRVLTIPGMRPDTEEWVQTSLRNMMRPITDAVSDLDTLKSNTLEAAQLATTAAGACDTSRQQIESQEQTRQSQEQTRQSQEGTRQSQEQGRVTEFATLKSLSEAATANANEAATHPTKVDASGWVYEWDMTTHAYNKTDKNIRGRDFHVDKVFQSIAEMNAYVALDPRPADDKLKEGNFFMINTGDVEDPDTAKLYQVNALLQPELLTDMSGVRGFTGRTPQFSVGTVTTGDPDSPAAVSISPDGEDAQGNPKFKLNLTIPKGDTFTWNDLTPANITELQRPATEAAARADEKAALANEKAGYAQAQGDYALNVGSHPPYIADGTLARPGDVGFAYWWDYANQTYVKGVRVSLDWSTMSQEEQDALAAEVLAQLAFDDTPTQDSNKAVRSSGIYTALAGKQDTLTFATVETCESVIDELVAIPA